MRESKKVHTSELQEEQELVGKIWKVLLTVIAYLYKDTFTTYFARVWAPEITSLITAAQEYISLSRFPNKMIFMLFTELRYLIFAIAFWTKKVQPRSQFRMFSLVCKPFNAAAF